MQKYLSRLFMILSVILLFRATYILIFPVSSSLLCTVQQQTMAKSSTVTYDKSSISLPASQKEPSLYAKAYCVYDDTTGQVLYGKNLDRQMPMASTTKIMTCILALEHASAKDVVHVSKYAASMPDVQLNMVSGDTFYLKDLYYSLMLSSHNDTAVAIAEHVSGSVEKFANLMNKKAQEIGCTQTHFVTPNGLDDKNHYTTAKDLCLIASYALKNKKFQKIIQTSSHSFSNCKGTRSYHVTSTNRFLKEYPGALGIKTGFTSKAGYCFCGAAKQKGRQIITTVLASGWPPNKSYKWSDTKNLMNYGFKNFATKTLKMPSVARQISVKNATVPSIALSCQLPKEIKISMQKNDCIKVKIQFQKKNIAPIKKGAIIGRATIIKNNKKYASYPILAKQSAPERNFSFYLKKILELL